MQNNKATKVAGALVTAVGMASAVLGGPVVPTGAKQTVESQARQAEAQIARTVRNGGQKPGQTSGR